jgi:tellurite resistance protein
VTRTTLPFARILDDTIVRAPRAGDPAPDGPAPGLDDAERDSVLEIALLMATANGSTSPEELDSLADLVAHLRGKRPLPGQLSTLMNAIEARGIGGTVEERVRAIAASLRRDLPRELAYKAAYAIRVSDLESNPDEEDLGEILVDVLGFSDDLAASLESEVNEALIAD